MDDVTLKALQTYQENLEYLREVDNVLYDKILLLSQLIDENKYQEHYTLEYKDEGYFDILELSSNQLLYKENSITNAQRLVNGFDFKRTGAVFKGQKYVYASDKQANLIDKSELDFHNTLWSTIKIISYVSKFAHTETHMLKVYKNIFLDVGLGLHIEDIVKKYASQVVYIQEKNLETFRLSLFVTNYKNIFKNIQVFFAITAEESIQREKFLAFLNVGNNHNLHMKFIPFTQNYQMEVQRLQSHVLSQSYINYGYSAMLLRFIDSPKYLVQNYSFLNMMKRYHGTENNILSEKPVLLLFSGPSTSKNIEWIKTNHKRFITVSALSTCRLLKKEGIRPDIIMHVDPGKDSELLFEGLEPKVDFKDSLVILASNVDETTMNRFDKKNIHFIEQGTHYKKDFGHFSAPSVGEYTYGLFLILGISKMYLLGIDLALDPETLQSHGELHPYQKTGKLDTQSTSLDPNASIEFVKGNLLEKVPTLSAYTISIEQANTFNTMLKKDHHKVYNLSNGAYLEGCEPLKISDYAWDELEVLDTEETTKRLHHFFHSITEAEFNDKDKSQLRYQIKEAKKLEKIIKNFKKKRFLNHEVYLNAVAQLSWDLSDMDYKSNSDLAQVYYEYFSIILSYIFDLFNTEELTEHQKHVTQIHSILMRQLLKMSSLYISRLEKYI